MFPSRPPASAELHRSSATADVNQQGPTGRSQTGADGEGPALSPKSLYDWAHRHEARRAGGQDDLGLQAQRSSSGDHQKRLYEKAKEDMETLE